MLLFEVISEHYGEHIKEKADKYSRAQNFMHFFEFIDKWNLWENDILRMTDLDTNEVIYELKI